MEIALDGEKDLLGIIQHQPFYSSHFMFTWVWAHLGRGFQSLSAEDTSGKNAGGTEQCKKHSVCGGLSHQNYQQGPTGQQIRSNKNEKKSSF